MQVTNNSGVSLPLAVWLLHDEYDYVDKPNYVSVTRLMKPLKQLVLPQRIPQEERSSDVVDYIARKLGHAIHDSIETAWKTGYRRSLKLLGYGQDVIDKIIVNPTQDQLFDGCIPVYLEQRAFRDIVINDTVFTIGGKFDMVSDGILNDNKSTSAYGWKYGTRDDEHQLQMSLYRWIDAGQEYPKVTDDVCNVNYVFTDWQKSAARQSPDYPQKRVEQKSLSLLSLDEVEAFIRFKLGLFIKYLKAPEADMPPCTDAELWRAPPSYRYYKDPAKAQDPSARSTRNFDSLAEANLYMSQQGGVGVVMTKLGEVKACGYCEAFNVCKQKDQYFS